MDAKSSRAVVRSVVQYTFFPFESEYWSHDAGVARITPGENVRREQKIAGGPSRELVRFAIALALAIALAALAPLRSNPT
jgi:hypothetical protein